MIMKISTIWIPLFLLILFLISFILRITVLSEWPHWKYLMPATGILFFLSMMLYPYYRRSSEVNAMLDKEYAKSVASWDTPKAKAWMLDFADFYKPLGFFAVLKEMSNEEFAEELIKLAKNEATPFKRPYWYLEQWILNYDEYRVCGGDMERDVGPPMDGEFDGEYVEFIEELKNISCGNFNPQEISEVWDSDEGPVSVTFKINNVTYEVNPVVDDDWLDPSIIKGINKSIANTGHKFYAVYDQGQGYWFYCLTEDEMKILKKERKYKFEF
jgi:hypothetical protein